MARVAEMAPMTLGELLPLFLSTATGAVRFPYQDSDNGPHVRDSDLSFTPSSTSTARHFTSMWTPPFQLFMVW